MRVLQVVLRGEVTSFRYPQFVQGIQPTYPLPPPSTIYGHICSTLGFRFDPSDVQFAYHFTSSTSFDDIEHTHVMTEAETRYSTVRGSGQLRASETVMQPYRRSLLFQPSMTLYLNRPDWYDAFRQPSGVVRLGRSQDLCSYSRVSIVDLATADEAYLAHTLLPFEMAAMVRQGVTLMMPRMINEQRQATWQRYVALQEKVRTSDLLHTTDFSPTYHVDPEAPKWGQLGRAVVWHRFEDNL